MQRNPWNRCGFLASRNSVAMPDDASVIYDRFGHFSCTGGRITSMEVDNQCRQKVQWKKLLLFRTHFWILDICFMRSGGPCTHDWSLGLLSSVLVLPLRSIWCKLHQRTFCVFHAHWLAQIICQGQRFRRLETSKDFSFWFRCRSSGHIFLCTHAYAEIMVRNVHLHVPWKPHVRPHPNNAPKQYHILVTRGWMNTLAIRSDFDFKFSGFRVLI